MFNKKSKKKIAVLERKLKQMDEHCLSLEKEKNEIHEKHINLIRSIYMGKLGE